MAGSQDLSAIFAKTPFPHQPINLSSCCVWLVTILRRQVHWWPL